LCWPFYLVLILYVGIGGWTSESLQYNFSGGLVLKLSFFKIHFQTFNVCQDYSKSKVGYCLRQCSWSVSWFVTVVSPAKWLNQSIQVMSCLQKGSLAIVYVDFYRLDALCVA